MNYRDAQFRETRSRIEALCRQKGADRLFVLTDSGVAPLARDFLADCPRLEIEAGEGSKTLSGAEKVWKFLVDGGAIRRSVLVNVGGGMVSDLGGFAAATFKRGIGCINVPTTLLAAVDAAIGGKTAVNFMGLKNEIGVFAMPWGVFPLTSLFASLPEEEWLSGVGEALKTGLLCSERLFSMASSRDFILERKPDTVEKVTTLCARFKEDIVKRDFREGGLRKILNLGHTAGHAIEALGMSQGKHVPHGIAVAHGLLVALKKSCGEAGLAEDVMERYETVLKQFFPPLDIGEGDRERLADFMKHDKKITQSGSQIWVLLKAIGSPICSGE